MKKKKSRRKQRCKICKKVVNHWMMSNGTEWTANREHSLSIVWTKSFFSSAVLKPIVRAFSSSFLSLSIRVVREVILKLLSAIYLTFSVPVLLCSKEIY